MTLGGMVTSIRVRPSMKRASASQPECWAAGRKAGADWIVEALKNPYWQSIFAAWRRMGKGYRGLKAPVVVQEIDTRAAKFEEDRGEPLSDYERNAFILGFKKSASDVMGYLPLVRRIPEIPLGRIWGE